MEMKNTVKFNSYTHAKKVLDCPSTLKNLLF